MRASKTVLFLAFILAFAAACGESPTRPTTPALRLVAGTGITDTISAEPAQGLVAEVIGTSGPEAGVSVEFEAQPDTSGCYFYCFPVMLSPDGAQFLSTTSATTDAKGRAVVRLRFGTLAGPAKVMVRVPLYGLLDTARYTVTPGAPVGFRVLPRDTAVEVQGTFSLTASSVVDRANNPRSGPVTVTYEAASSVVRVDGSGLVTGVSVGRGFVRARATVGGTTIVDSAGVSVVPAARVVFETAGRTALQISNLTGTSIRTLVSYPAGAGAWSPAGDRLAFCHDPYPVWDIGVVDTLGNATMLTNGGGGCWPQFSPDGQWIYYHDRSNVIRRIHPDGTGVDSLFSGEFVTTAPDGYRVAFQVAGALTIGDVRSRTVAAVPGVTDVSTLRWSPDGQMIAYVSGYNQVRVVRPDGSRVRDFSGSYDNGLGWSPDSRFIVASDGSLVLLDVTTGSILPTPVLGWYPNWAP